MGVAMILFLGHPMEDWLYPQNNNFFADEQPVHIAKRIITAWHQKEVIQ